MVPNDQNPNYDQLEWSMVRISAFSWFRTFGFRHSTVWSFPSVNLFYWIDPQVTENDPLGALSIVDSPTDSLQGKTKSTRAMSYVEKASSPLLVICLLWLFPSFGIFTSLPHFFITVSVRNPNVRISAFSDLVWLSNLSDFRLSVYSVPFFRFIFPLS